MVFQKPTPFPMSIYDNIAFGIRLYENLPQSEMDDRVEIGAAPRGAVGRGQGQAAAERPQPVRRPAAAPVHRARDRDSSRRSCCSTSRPRRSTRSRPQRIEELIAELKTDYCIVIVTHNMQQAARTAGLHGVHVSGRADRVRRTTGHLHASEQAADRGLRHRPVRLSGGSGGDQTHGEPNTSSSASTRSSNG